MEVDKSGRFDFFQVGNMNCSFLGTLATTDYIFQVGTDGTNCGVMKVALMTSGTWTSSASTVPLNAWTHVAVSFDGTTNRFYINGVMDRAVAAAASVFQSLTLLRDGSVRGRGLNADGQVNIPPSANDIVAIAAGQAFSLALKADGMVVGWGNQFYLPLGVTNIVAIAAQLLSQHGVESGRHGQTAPVNLPARYNTSTFFATLDGLVPGATYHFRVAASNSLGVAYGPDQTFTVPTLFAAGDLNGDGRVDQSQLNNVLSNYWLTGTSIVMTNPSTPGGGLFQFALTNVTGWNLSVSASTNLSDWELLLAPARPVWQFFDPAYTNYPQRFYRLQWP